MSNDSKNREKETKKAAAKKTAKKTDSGEASLTKEEKAAEAKDLYTRQFIARVEEFSQRREERQESRERRVA